MTISQNKTQNSFYENLILFQQLQINLKLELYKS